MTDSFRILALERLSAHGVDVRSTTLRVATDLFCQNSNHPPEDVARYCDLAAALLDVVDAETRIAVARKLAETPQTPQRLIRRLLDDRDVMVASTVLAAAPDIPVGDRAGFLAQCGPAEAAAIAWRHDLDSRAMQTLASHPHHLVAEALAENHAVKLDETTVTTLVHRARSCRGICEGLFARKDVPPLLMAPIYDLMPHEFRRLILFHVEQELNVREAPVAPGDIEAINSAVASRELQAIGAALAGALRVDPHSISSVVNDPTGELYVLALSAAGYRRPAAMAIMLVTAPECVRTSVTRIFAAADLHDTWSRRTARYVVGQVAGERSTAPVRHEAHMHASGTPARPGAAASSQRAMAATRVQASSRK